MEAGGLVSSQWERSPSGPRRRRYCATRQGRQLLCRWAGSLEQADELICAFLVRFRAGAETAHANGVNESNGTTDHTAFAETEASLVR
jgi:DNA-binding PadR family transcriptional regulator